MKDVIDFEKAKNEKGYHDLEATIDRLRNNIRDLLSMNTQYKTELADQIVKINKLEQEVKDLKKKDRITTVLVRDLQQILGNFTDKFNKGVGKVEGKGNAIMYAKVYIDLGNGRLSEIQKIEAQENTLIGAKEGVRVVLKPQPQNKSKIII